MPLKTHRDDEPTLNLTSMIDVLFLLIIFFMAGTKFTEMERSIGLNVPQVADPGAMTPAPEPKVVSVYKDGQVTLGSRDVTLEQLTGLLATARQQYKDLTVLVRGDQAATHGRMSQVYSACKKAGVSEMAISVKVESKTR